MLKVYLELGRFYYDLEWNYTNRHKSHKQILAEEHHLNFLLCTNMTFEKIYRRSMTPFRKSSSRATGTESFTIMKFHPPHPKKE